MAKVRIRRAGFSGPGKLTNERLADALVRTGRFEVIEDARSEPVATAEPAPEPETVVAFDPSPKLDEAVEAEEKPKAKPKRKRTYKRRDMKAED